MEDTTQHKNSTSDPIQCALELLVKKCSRLGHDWRVSGITEYPNPNNMLPDSLFRWNYDLTNDARIIHGCMIYDGKDYCDLASFEDTTGAM